MELTHEEQEISDLAVEYVKSNKRELIRLYADSDLVLPQKEPLAVFMSGSPGAGKTEFSKSLLEQFSNENIMIARVDPDLIRMSLPGYAGGNAYVLQKATSRAVDEIFSSLLKKGQSFLLDGTFSNYEKAEQNIERVLKRGYRAVILYVYQDPESAWRFTRAREKEEGRRIELETFISQYFAAKETVDALKQKFGNSIRVSLIVKDSLHNIKKYEGNIKTIDSFIKTKYTAKTLKEVLTNA